MRILFTLIFVLFSLFTLISQQTVGILEYKPSKTYQGYTLIYPHNQPNTYLIDNCGEVVHTWTDSLDFRPGNTAYLLDDGRLVKTKRRSSVTGDGIWAGGGGAFIEIRSWDNDLLWSYELNNDDRRLHHDIAITPDETILAIAWERISEEDALAAGRDSATLAQGDLWPDYVFEIDPETDDIIWEWHAWDHIIQDRDPAKPNYGIIADNQRRIDINWDTNAGKSDWHHMNSIDYNPELDQIMLSVPQYNEIWIIDHTTSTEQAASSQGGDANHGGDLIYRAGNPQAYGRGDSTNQILFFQHDAHWLFDIPESHPLHGQIAVFNNRVGADFSTAEIFPSEWEMYVSDYPLFEGTGTWPPFVDTDRITLSHPIPQKMYSTGLSSIQVLENGNYLLCSGRFGYIFEMTLENEIVWEYKTPIMGGMPVDQGTELSINNNLTFRAYKYSEDFPAFEGKDLTSKGFIETNPDTSYCSDLILSILPILDQNISITPNPATDMVKVKWETGKMVKVNLTDISGVSVLTETGNGGNLYLDTSNLRSEENVRYLK